MRVLLIKLSSMGDVIHALPAVSDAQQHLPHIRFDWVVEQAFADIPAWHDAVETIIPVAMRRWRKQLWHSRSEILQARHRLRAQSYDAVIDAQGLLKSAFLGRLARGATHGYAADSCREPLASYWYRHGHSVDPRRHAIERIRALFAESLGYAQPVDQLSYGIRLPILTLPEEVQLAAAKPYVLFLHGTTWLAKQWPLNYWQALAGLATRAGYTVLLPWGNSEEQDRAQRIAQTGQSIHVLPRMSLSELGQLLNAAAGVVGVDTGLGHLSAALGRPTISIYGPTDTQLIGTVGSCQRHVQVPAAQRRQYRKHEAFDYATVPPELVWQSLVELWPQADCETAKE